MSISKETFKEMLRKKGLKVTDQRLLVLETLADHRDKHMTCEDIYEMVKAECPGIGLATIYRTVQLLLEMQLVDRISLDDGCVRYEIGEAAGDEGKHHHHHLICKTCGKILPFHDDLLDELEGRIEEETGFHVLDHELKFYGQCRECQKKENSTEQHMEV
ncbi:Fur family transcriptional regulator [uncultured Merdimonas sp.]|uniref:Fur family transcriptional regulator n=1 Tax=uncultured Merdimonas sp. TaxID=2023269 RepID=UPI003209F812